MYYKGRYRGARQYYRNKLFDDKPKEKPCPAIEVEGPLPEFKYQDLKVVWENPYNSTLGTSTHILYQHPSGEYLSARATFMGWKYTLAVIPSEN